MAARGIESLEGVSKKSSLTVSVSLLYFHPLNSRDENGYGFTNPEAQSLVQGQIEVLRGAESTLTEEQLEFVKSSLGDPEDDQSIGWLTYSISEFGVQQPMFICKEGNRVMPTDGNRRLTSIILCRLLNLKAPDTVAAMVDPWKGELGMLKRQAVSNRGSRKFSELEEARLFWQAHNLGMPHKAIGEELCSPQKTAQYVRLRLKLLELPIAVQNLIRSGKVRPTVALQLFEENQDVSSDILLKAISEAVDDTQGTQVNEQAEQVNSPEVKKTSKAKVEAKLKSLQIAKSSSAGSATATQAATEEDGERDAIFTQLKELVTRLENSSPSIASLRVLLQQARRAATSAATASEAE